MQSYFVTADTFEPERIQHSPPESKTAKIQENGSEQVQEIKYFVVHLSYSYPTVTQAGQAVDTIQPFLMEFPELCSRSGIKIVNTGKFPRASIMLNFDLKSESNLSFVEFPDHNGQTGTMWRMYDRILDVMFKLKGGLGLGPVKQKDHLTMTLPNPIYWPRDEATSELIKGRDPMKWVDLIYYDGGKIRTQFYLPIRGPDGKFPVVDWADLQDVTMMFRPLIEVRQIYVGTKSQIKMRMKSAIITKLQKNNSVAPQLKSLEEMQADIAGIERIRQEYQELLRLNRENDEKKDQPANESKQIEYKPDPKESKAPLSPSGLGGGNPPGIPSISQNNALKEFLDT